MENGSEKQDLVNELARLLENAFADRNRWRDALLSLDLPFRKGEGVAWHVIDDAVAKARTAPHVAAAPEKPERQEVRRAEEQFFEWRDRESKGVWGLAANGTHWDIAKTAWFASRGLKP